MHPRKLRGLWASAVVSLSCTPSPPAPGAASVVLTVEPAPAPAPPETAEPALVAKTPAELVSVEAMLQEGDTHYFAGKFEEARARFETAWAQMHPNPLALVMAGHAARRKGDSAAAEALFERARREAGREAKPACSEFGSYLATFDGPSSAWVSSDLVDAKHAWLRVDVKEGRVLYGFCSEATRDPATKAHAPVTWMPSLLDARWHRPEPPGCYGTGTAVDLIDLVYGGVVGSVPHTVAYDCNSGYYGALAFSEDRVVLASGADEPTPEVRVWRVADRTLVRAIPTAEPPMQIALSRDGARAAVATCSDVTLWDTTTGKRIAKVDYRYFGCASDNTSPSGMAFSPDSSLLAIGHAAIGSPKNHPPASEGLYWFSLFRTRDGRRVKRWAEEDQANKLVFSPDGAIVAGHHVFGSTGFLLYDLKSGPQQPVDDGGWPNAFSPDGRTLLTAGGLFDLSKHDKPARVIEYDVPGILERLGPYLLPARAKP